MKRPFNYILALTISTVFYACTTTKMQVVSLESDKIIKNDSTWVYSDSLADFLFNFYSEKGSQRFTINNKGNKPVFCDLKNSFISVNDFKKELWEDVSQVKEDLVLNLYGARYGKTHNPINGTVSRPERIIMIPPNAMDVVSTFVNLKSKLYDMHAYKLSTDTVAANWTSNTHKKTLIRSANFDRNNSPTKVRLYIALSRTEDFKNPVYLDLYFWTSKIMEMDERQATQSSFPSDYYTGFYTLSDVKNPTKHPYKKSWRFYIPDSE